MTASVRPALGVALGAALALTGVGVTAATAQPAPAAGVSATASQPTAVSATASQPTPVVTAPAQGLVTIRTPMRVIDTRPNSAVPPGGEAQYCTVPGQVPTSASAVFLNITAVLPRRAGHLSVYPLGFGEPTTSSLNFAAGETVANHAIVAFGAVGCIAIRNNSPAATHLVVDLQGWVEGGPGTAAGTMTALSYPVRAVDTRLTGRAVPAHGYVDVPVTGRGGVPATGVGSVALNLTVTRATVGGYALAAPSGLSKRPTGTTVSFLAGRDRAGFSVVRVANGKVRLYNESAKSAHFVADVFGFVRSGATSQIPAAWVGSDPTRAYDSRLTGGPLGPGESRRIPLPSLPSDASAAALTVTMTGATTAGHLTTAAGVTSLLNFEPGRTVTNSLLVAPTTDDDSGPGVAITNRSSGPVHVIVDVTGYVRPQIEVTGTARLVDGTPLAGATVTAGPELPGTTTDGNGRYRLVGNLPTGGSALASPCFSVLAVGGQPDETFALTCDQRRAPPPSSDPWPVGTRAVVDGVLERAGNLQGTFVSDNDLPVVLGRLTMRRVSDDASFKLHLSDGEGHWSMPSLPVGDYVIHVFDPHILVTGGSTLAQQWLQGVPNAYLQSATTQSMSEVMAGHPRIFRVTVGATTDADAVIARSGKLSVTASKSAGYFPTGTVIEATFENGAVLSAPVPLDRSPRTLATLPGKYTNICIVSGATRTCWDDPDDPVTGPGTALVETEKVTSISITVP